MPSPLIRLYEIDQEITALVEERDRILHAVAAEYEHEEAADANTD